MSAELFLQLLGGAGFLAGVAAILHFLNTRKSTRTKGSAEAYQAYRDFVHGATDDRDKEIGRLRADREVRDVKIWKLTDLAQDLIGFAKSKGATTSELDRFQDRLDIERAR